MKGRPIDQLVYECMFPKPKADNPQSFQSLLQRQLVPEVRLETQAFYGHLSSQEAKYPGLDYSYQPHRVRLSRYPWHRRLFRAFDVLRLTPSEIASLTKWEGTRWAKERFEREQGVIIRDTTSDDIKDWVEPELRPSRTTPSTQQTSDMEDIQEGEVEEPEGMDEDEEESDAEIQSVGIELNERIRAAVAQREAGHTDVSMDEEWEQWLKDAIDAGGLPFLSTDIPGTRPVSSTRHSTLYVPGPHHTQNGTPQTLHATRLGAWHQIPDFLQNMVRQNLEANSQRPGANSLNTSNSTSSSTSTPRTASVPTSQLQTQTPAAAPPRPHVASTAIINRSSPEAMSSEQIPARRMLRYAPAFRVDGEPANEVR